MPARMSSKASLSMAVLPARDGKKAGNKLVKLVKTAAVFLPETSATKKLLRATSQEASSSNENRQALISGYKRGMLLRSMGETWRGCVPFAIAVEVAEARDEEGTKWAGRLLKA